MMKAQGGFRQTALEKWDGEHCKKSRFIDEDFDLDQGQDDFKGP